MGLACVGEAKVGETFYGRLPARGRQPAGWLRVLAHDRSGLDICNSLSASNRRLSIRLGGHYALLIESLSAAAATASLKEGAGARSHEEMPHILSSIDERSSRFMLVSRYTQRSERE